MKTQVSEKQAEARTSNLFQVRIVSESTSPDVADTPLSSGYFRTKTAAWEQFARMYGYFCMLHPSDSNYVQTNKRSSHLLAFAHIKLSPDSYIGIFLEKRARD